MESPQKSLKWATVWSGNFTLGIYPNKIKALTKKDIYIYPYVHCIIIYNSQDMETTCVHQQMNG